MKKPPIYLLIHLLELGLAGVSANLIADLLQPYIPTSPLMLGGLVGLFIVVVIVIVWLKWPKIAVKNPLDRIFQIIKHPVFTHAFFLLLGVLVGGIVFVSVRPDNTDKTPPPTATTTEAPVSPSLPVGHITVVRLRVPDGSFLSLPSPTAIGPYNCYKWEPEVAVTVEFPVPLSSCCQTQLFWVLERDGTRQDGQIAGSVDAANEKVYHYFGTLSLSGVLSSENLQVVSLELYVQGRTQADSSWKNLLDKPVKIEKIICEYEGG